MELKVQRTFKKKTENKRYSMKEKYWSFGAGTAKIIL
jgi:hypothetical protein